MFQRDVVISLYNALFSIYTQLNTEVQFMDVLYAKHVCSITLSALSTLSRYVILRVTLVP